MQSAVIQLKEPRPAAHAAPRRVDLYSGIHKAMRMMMCDTLVALGRLDTADAEELASTLARLRQAISLARQHLHKEDHHVHPAMESRRRGSTAGMRRDHRGHETAFEHLEALALRVECSHGPARDEAALELYRAFALHMAVDFVHMQTEETENNAVLWEHFDDGELAAIHRAILASIPAPLLVEYLRWLAPAMTPAERAELVSGMRAAMPAEAFAGVAALVRSVLGEHDWKKLLAALGPRPLAV